MSSAPARNKYRRKKKKRKFKQKTVLSLEDSRWRQHHGYDRKRLEARKKRAAAAAPAKERKRSHTAIQSRRHAYFTKSKGAHCIGIKPTRLEEHMRRRLRRAQIRHARLLSVDVRNGRPVRLSPEFIKGVIAMVDGLLDKVLQRTALLAAHRQSGRSNSSGAASAKPSYMGMMSDLVLALHTIITDAKK